MDDVVNFALRELDHLKKQEAEAVEKVIATSGKSFRPEMILEPLQKEVGKVERIRVARWFLLRPNIPIWEYFGGHCNGNCCYIFWSFGLFYEHWVYFTNIW
jgi:hypothetical protein